MRIRNTLLTMALVAAVPSSARAVPSEEVAIRTIHATFEGVLRAESDGWYHASECAEVNSEDVLGLDCQFWFKITKGGLTCDGAGRPETTGLANFRSESLGITFTDNFISGVTINQSGHLRGTILSVDPASVPITRMLNIDIGLASLCSGDQQKTFTGVVTYL